jgi:hypothetical protein
MKKQKVVAGVSMAKVKLLLSIFVAVLILSGSSLFLVSYALPWTQKGDIAYTTLVGQLNPFPFPTITPTPTATPVPTVTPVPTPRPEPSARPTLELYCRSTATVSTLQVDVTGTLTYNKTGIPNAAMYIGYSADGGDKWENFELVKTDAAGDFGATWIPNATGNYLMCAQWEGNLTLHWINATISLALTPDSAGNVFSVISNSTLADLTYDSETQELSFITNGTSSTGYVYACIPKALLSNIQALQVNIDGKSIAFGSESQNDVWIVSCVYAQSEHIFTIQIPFMQALDSDTIPWNVIAIVLVIVVLIVILAIAVIIRRRHRTAALVASILKQNR